MLKNGVILGLTFGGLVLNLYANNFQMLMTIFGAAGIALAPLVFLLTRDPTKAQARLRQITVAF
jgi:hypothetical protein